MNLPSTTTQSFVIEHEKKIPYGLQYDYFKNEERIQKLESSIAEKTKCLSHNKGITGSVNAELRRAETAFKTGTPTTKRYHLLEQEAITLQSYINEKKQLLAQTRNAQSRYQKQLVHLKKKIKEFGRWSQFWRNDKFAALKTSAKQLNRDLEQGKATIAMLTKTIAQCEQEAQRLVPLIEYGRRSAQEHAVRIESLSNSCTTKRAS
jgi:chromosome segregation ATPase